MVSQRTSIGTLDRDVYGNPAMGGNRDVATHDTTAASKEMAHMLTACEAMLKLAAKSSPSRIPKARFTTKKGSTTRK